MKIGDPIRITMGGTIQALKKDKILVRLSTGDVLVLTDRGEFIEVFKPKKRTKRSANTSVDIRCEKC